MPKDKSAIITVRLVHFRKSHFLPAANDLMKRFNGVKEKAVGGSNFRVLSSVGNRIIYAPCDIQ